MSGYDSDPGLPLHPPHYRPDTEYGIHVSAQLPPAQRQTFWRQWFGLFLRSVGDDPTLVHLRTMLRVLGWTDAQIAHILRIEAMHPPSAETYFMQVQGRRLNNDWSRPPPASIQNISGTWHL